MMDINKIVMKEFIALNSTEYCVVNVVDIKLKDEDDEDGCIGEHFIVTCQVADGNKIDLLYNTCLVNKHEFIRYNNRIKTIKWYN